MELLLNELRKKGVQLQLVDAQLKLSAPAGILTPVILEQIRGNKEAIITYLKDIRKEEYQPIPLADVMADYPLSHSQQRLWVQDQLHGHGATYNIPVVYRLHGAVDIAALEASFRQLSDRHEILRTVFVLRDGVPRQRILAAAADGYWSTRDFSVLPSPEESAQDYIRDFINAGFDLKSGPLLRVALLRLSATEWLLAWSMHHIISDEWSMQVMVRELVKVYNHHTAGHSLSMSVLPLQYKDYAVWQQIALSGDQLATHRDYWLSRLSGELPLLELPADHSRPQVQAHHGGHVSFRFDTASGKSYQELLHGQDATLFMGVLSLVNVLLYRYSGQSDLIISSPVAGRHHPDLEDQIGYYLNTLALRNEVNGNTGFKQLLSSVRDTTLSGFDHQVYPFDMLVEELGLGGDLSRSPLSDVVVILQNVRLNDEKQLEMHGLEVVAETASLDISKGDLRFQFYHNEHSDVLYGNIEYNSAIFNRERIERMATHLCKLMDAVLADPDMAIDNIVYQAAGEQEDESWFTAPLPGVAQPLLHRVIEERVRQYPDRIALSGYGLRVRYEELNSYANQLSHGLLSFDCGHESTVGVYAGGGPLQVVALLACFKAGAVYVPMSADQAAQQLLQVIEDTGMKAIITTAAHVAGLQQFLNRHGVKVATLMVIDNPAAAVLPLTVYHQDQMEHPVFSTSNVDLSYSEFNSAYIFYTSGSTGRSKGIIGSHTSLSHYIHWHQREWGIDGSFRISQLAPMTFDASLKDILTGLIGGATICMPESNIKNNPALLVEWLRSEEITLLQTVPSVFRLITGSLQESGQPFTALRYVVLAGERLYGRDVLNWKAANGTAARLSNLYGLTETTILKTCFHIDHWDWQAGEVLPVGFPVADTLVGVINNSHHLCVAGEMGEVYIRSPYITKGYVSADLNSGYLVANPLNGAAGDQLWRTGDLGRYRRDGSLEILGRRDEQVKINGVRVELEQVRAALLEQEGVSRTELVVHTGEDFRQELLCYYSGHRYEAEELRTLLSAKLNAALLPGYYVWMDTFPLNMNGKVDRNALPRPEEMLLQSTYDAPQAGLEQQLSALWQQVLGLSRVGRGDNFFTIGGSSLKAIQLIARIYKELDVQLTIAELFSHPVLHQLASLIKASVHTSYQPIPLADVMADYPLSHSQQRLWVQDQLHGHGATYNIPVVYRLHGALDIAALEASFRQLSDRHEILRTVFVLRDGVPRQRILAAAADGYWSTRDFSGLPSPEESAQDYIRDFINAGFDLKSGPLLRVALLRLSATEWLLAWSMHHIISDEWSMQVMVRELVRVYNHHTAGHSLSMSVLPLQYKDYAVWQQIALSGDQLATHRDYWLSRLSGELPLLELPADHSRPQVQAHHGGHVSFRFDTASGKSYQELLHGQDATLFMGVLSLVNVLLYRYSGQSDLIISSPVAGRHHPDLEDQIGYYLNTLALRNEVNGNTGFKQLLSSVRDTTLSGFDHQVYPFDMLVEELGLGGDLSRSPLSDVVVILQNVRLNDEKQLEMHGLEVVAETASLDISKGDLRFQFYHNEHSDVLYGNIEYNSAIFNRERIERMATHLCKLMDAVLADPDMAIDNIAYQAAGEQEDESWFTAPLPGVAQPLLHRVIEERVRQYPDRIALSGYGLRVRYEELNSYANQLSHGLLSFDCGHESTVGVYAGGGPLQVLALLACFKAGAVYVPMSADQAAQQLLQVMEDTGMKAIITTAAHVAGLQQFLTRHGVKVATLMVIDNPAAAVLPLTVYHQDQMEHPVFSTSNVDLSYSEFNSAYIFYTSGSTGRSKGIIGSHTSLSHYIHWHQREWGIDGSFRISQLAPMTFDASLKDILTGLIGGATICMPESNIKNNPALLVEWLRSEEITLLQTVPSVFRLITGSLQESGQPFTALRYVVLAGERLYGRDVLNWKAANGTAARLSNLYGLTETTILKTCFHIDHWDWQAGEVLPVGFPVADTLVGVINNSHHLCVAGEMGEVYIRSPYITKGYVSADLNSGYLVANPLNGAAGDLLWRTGDLGRYRRDGSLEILGRRDEQVKINGVRIELEQVRAALLEQEGVSRTELVVHTGEDFRQELLCYYSGHRYEAEELRSLLSAKLNAALLPGYYVWMDTFPLNMNGKVDRNALPRPEEMLLQSTYDAPQAGLEQQLSALWQQVLGLSRVGRGDNFFTIGGSSLKAIQLIARIYKELDVQLTIAELFSHPVLHQLASQIKASVHTSYGAHSIS
ncbi:condensation domain-containing protein [Chitinophaga sancti]|uniref:Condensation domain-containing protein n=1 Tax=Chitinophaga sancti TaxID=1004 RepID=A0ABZ0XI47_9BACT|nr:condensation domain-containing protein [Chitinophaga sancti]WQG89862.1 condensation domain-containing protein [Chitinophaga sancti]